MFILLMEMYPLERVRFRVIYVVSVVGYEIMLHWVKNNLPVLLTALTCCGFLVYCYGCEPKTRSLISTDRLINRQELQLELDQFITMAQIRMADLDKQEQLRAVILQNALILVQGQPYNPVGIITAIAAVYGISQGTRNVKQVIKKRKVNNG